jgi:hypothetical protein
MSSNRIGIGMTAVRQSCTDEACAPCVDPFQTNACGIEVGEQSLPEFACDGAPAKRTPVQKVHFQPELSTRRLIMFPAAVMQPSSPAAEAPPVLGRGSGFATDTRGTNLSGDHGTISICLCARSCVRGHAAPPAGDRGRYLIEGEHLIIDEIKPRVIGGRATASPDSMRR